MKVQRCKGTRDLSPQEMRRFRLIETVFRDCCLKWGYEEIRTPTLESLHLFTSAGTLTPSMLSRVYSFLDWDGWSGERVVLRPDNTIPTARLYIDNMADSALAKLFYIANVFIFEETGKENREKWQCGAELIGGGPPLADVELITMSLEVLKKLGITNIELKLSHAGLIKAILQKLGLSPEEQNRVFDQILDGDEEVLTRLEAEKPELGRALLRLLDLNGKSSAFVKNSQVLLSPNIPEVKHYLDDFTKITELLQTLGYKYQIDIASGRGFEYYTGIIFQLFTGGKKIGGGGRYDVLIPLIGGKDTPASGFALYFDRLMNLIKPEAPAEPPAPKIMVNFDIKNSEATRTAFAIASRMRDSGFTAVLNAGIQKQADLRWELEVRNEKPQFVLTDLAGNKNLELATAEEILTALGH